MSTLRFRLNVGIWQLCIFVSVFILTDSLFIDSDKLIVNTKWGFVRGKWSKTLRDRQVANFLGIPYALPPVGELRFRSPQRWNRAWTTIRNATNDGHKCIQLNEKYKTVVGNEDCLYLNVFVPHTLDEQQRKKKLPVLVYVHGGGYKTGSSDSAMYAPDYLLEQDIIFVTMNYRLAALGFFTTLNRASPGNYGIKDVKMALEWVQENIHSFGGNSKEVTLMGHSAGSSIAHILALSKKTEGLFHRYILLSGAAIWGVQPQRTIRQTSLKFVKLVGCQLKKDIIAANQTIIENPEEDVKTSAFNDILYPDHGMKDDEKIMKCMRKIDAETLTIMTQYLFIKQKPKLIFAPTLEDDSKDAILTMHPLKIMKDGLFRDIPAIFQVVKDEGLVNTLKLYTNPDKENELIENFEEDLPFLVEYHYKIFNTSIFASAIQDFYFNGNVTSGIIPNITKVVTDGIIWPMFQSLQYQSEIGKSNVYFSFFAYQGTFSYTFGSGTPTYYGVDHGDDLNYLFPILNNVYRDLLLHNTENDITMINVMTELWASFITKGIPKAWMIPAWPSYRDHHQFMRFGIDRLPEAVVQTDFLPDRMEFWEKLTLNESTELESMNDLIARGLSNDTFVYSNAIDRRLTVQLISLVLIYFYL